MPDQAVAGALTSAAPRVASTATLARLGQARLREVAIADLDLRFESLRIWDRGVAARLRASIQREGIHQPILVSDAAGDGDGVLVVVDGFKRVHIGKDLGLEQVTVRVVGLDAASCKAMLVVANETRQPLSEIEEGLVVRSLHREDGLSQTDIAALVGHHKSWVCRRLQLLERLSREVQSSLQLGLLSATTARALAGLPRSNQREAAQVIAEHALSTRQAERLVAVLKGCNASEREAVLADPLDHLSPPRSSDHFGRDRRLGRAANRIREQILRLESGASRLLELTRAHAPASLGASQMRPLAELCTSALPPLRRALYQIEDMSSELGDGVAEDEDSDDDPRA